MVMLVGNFAFKGAEDSGARIVTSPFKFLQRFSTYTDTPPGIGGKSCANTNELKDFIFISFSTK
jgi:hypothetical protein